jgi:hypothetical protein
MIIWSTTFCVFLEIGFIRRCKKVFYWLLIMWKIRERVNLMQCVLNLMKLSKSKYWKWLKLVFFSYTLEQENWFFLFIIWDGGSIN